MVASHMSPAGDLAHNPGMCSDWESNQDPLVHRPALNPLSHTSLGSMCHYLKAMNKPNYLRICTRLSQIKTPLFLKFLVSQVHLDVGRRSICGLGKSMVLKRNMLQDRSNLAQCY